MRAVALLASLLLPGLTYAEAPKPLVVWQNRVIEAPPGTAALTSVSRTLYLNDCKPNGCTVTYGLDSSLTNRSTIPQQSASVTLDAYAHDQAHWDQLVACVKETFKPFDIQVVTTDPGPSVNHFEVMVGGTSRQLNPGLALLGGIAPYVSCGATSNNGLSFVFASSSANINFLCGAVAQEACHVWGLDHELDAKDPMTYLELNSSKRFQNNDADCGESTPRSCWCGGTTQNSYRYMTNTFGLSSSLAPATLTLETPTEGQWVKSSFPVRATFTSELYTLGVALSIDGAQVATVDTDTIAFNAPTVAGGPHTVSVSATDAGDRTVTQMVNVNVISACNAGSCSAGFHCLGGLCLPNSSVAGGLGAECVENGDCITESCGSHGTNSYCTGQCDPGDSCPSGFECLSDVHVCWPSESGGCATAGSSPGFLLLGLSALVFARRRRR